MWIGLFKNPLQRYLYQLLYSKYFDLGLRRVTKEAIKSTTYFLENVESLPDQDYLNIRYEDLCEAPEATIHKILGFLDLEARSTLEYQKLISPRAIELLPEVQRQYEPIRQKLQAYFAYHGYDS